MPREYCHIVQYEKEISELQEQGLTQRQIGERLGETTANICTDTQICSTEISRPTVLIKNG